MRIGKYKIYFGKWFVNVYRIEREDKSIQESTLLFSCGWQC